MKKYDIITTIGILVFGGLGFGIGRGNWDTPLESICSAMIPMLVLWIFYRFRNNGN